MVPVDLLSQAGTGNAPCQSWGRRNYRERQLSHQRTCRSYRTQACKDRGHAEVGRQQHEQYPAGAWLGPVPTWYNHPVLSPLVRLCLPAMPAQVRNLADLVVPTVHCVAKGNLEPLGTLLSTQPLCCKLSSRKPVQLED